jgi:hypothetical protein
MEANMNNNQVAKETNNFNKDLPDAVSDGMVASQEKTNNQISNFLGKNPFLPSESNRRILDFKARYGESYKKVFDYLVKT